MKTVIIVEKNGGVLQTVAFSAYINTEKDEKYKDELVEMITVLAKEKSLNLVPRGEISDLKGNAQEETIAIYKKLSREAKNKMDLATFDPVNVTDFVNHIDYLVQKTGIIT
jgi:membrane dipeptidase